MIEQLILLLSTAFITFILYPFWINFVYKYHMGEDIRTDGPNQHQIKKGTPTMGGLVFMLSVSLMTFLFNRSRTQTLFPVFVAALAGLFGMIEDLLKVYEGRRSLDSKAVAAGGQARSLLFSLRKDAFIFRPWNMFKGFWRVIGSSEGFGLQTYQKFMIQSLIGAFVAYWTYFKLGWDYIWFPLVGDVHIGLFYPIFIFFLFIIVLNFVAFADGLDGLAGGLALIAFAAYWAIASALSYNLLAGLSATFIGALIPFLYFNIFPARIFMGNVGSHVLGAVLTIFAVVMHREIALFFICFIFLLDGVTSPLQQISVRLTKKILFRMAPIHHHFEFLGWPETKVVMRFWLFGVFFAFLGIFVALL